jgi:hypothetical protein
MNTNGATAILVIIVLILGIVALGIWIVNAI